MSPARQAATYGIWLHQSQLSPSWASRRSCAFEASIGIAYAYGWMRTIVFRARVGTLRTPIYGRLGLSISEH